MTPSNHDVGLSRFAIVTALAALLLICVGGLVTSHGAGMAVPDWPTTYGHNMFLFPISQWTGGIFYEHSHRLIASGVGLLTIVLTVWLWLKETRVWLRWLGLAALALVIVQGVFGGLRVTEMMNELGIVHATLAQLFLVLLCAIALFTSNAWRRAATSKGTVEDYRSLLRLYAWATGLVLAQLVVAATMRHQHAGLAIPDFPLAYGKIWPDMDAGAVERYNQMRTEVTALNPITSFQVALQMAHRWMAVVILIVVGIAAAATRRRLGRGGGRLTTLTLVWLVLIAAQIGLGAATIWTNKSAEIATLHVAVGSLALVAGAMLILLAKRDGVLAAASASPDGLPGVRAPISQSPAGLPA